MVRLRKDHSKELKEFKAIVDGRQELIANLEAENKDLRKHLSKSKDFNIRDMNTLQESLKQSKELSDAQEININNLKTTIQKFKNQNRELRKDNKQLGNELKRLKRETKDFQESVGKMEKLVYGGPMKKFRSPRKPVV